MNLLQTTQVATKVSASADAVIADSRPLPIPALHAYWKISRTRLKCWLIGFESEEARDGRPRHRPDTLSLSRQILIAEMLTRVWTAILVARDEHQHVRDCSGLAHRVFLGQLEARQRVLDWLMRTPDPSQRHVVALDRLRKRVEHNTDLLLTPLLDRCDLREYAFCEHRVRAHAQLHHPRDQRSPQIPDGILPLRQLKSARESAPATPSPEPLELGLLRAIQAMMPAACGPMDQLAFPPTAAGALLKQAPVIPHAAGSRLHFSRIRELRRHPGSTGHGAPPLNPPKC